VLRVHQPGMAEPKRSRQLLRRSDMSKFGVEAEVVCGCSQRRPQDLVAPLTTTGQRRCRCRDRTATIVFMSSAILRDVAGNVGRGFQLLRNHLRHHCADRRVRRPSPRLRRRRLPLADQPEPARLADHGTVAAIGSSELHDGRQTLWAITRAANPRIARPRSRSSARLWAIRNSHARSGRSSCSSSRAPRRRYPAPHPQPRSCARLHLTIPVWFFSLEPNKKQLSGLGIRASRSHS